MNYSTGHAFPNSIIIRTAKVFMQEDTDVVVVGIMDLE
jgi:hypothetical protein